MAYTLTLLGTNTVYVPRPEHYDIEFCNNNALPYPLNANVIYITNQQETSFTYSLFDKENKLISNTISTINNPKLKNPSDKNEFNRALLNLISKTHHKIKVGYPRGESLGFISSQLIQKQVENNLTPSATLEHVVPGPKTLGSDVGIKIKEGLIKLLRAIAAGETELNIIAHSRGAVESILIANELQRIKDLVNTSILIEDSTSEENTHLLSVDSLTQSPCQLTSKALINEITRREKKDEMTKLLNAVSQKINAVNLNLFNIDPVPGDSDNHTLLLPGIAWVDKRFFNIPPIVKHYSLCLAENEHSRFFKPIIPKIAAPSKTKFDFFTFPGHHGTASGNPHSQNKARLEGNKSGEKTIDVQNLMICKMADFLLSHQVEFSLHLTQKMESPPLSLDTSESATVEVQPSLSTVLREHLQRSPVEKLTNLFHYYEKIHQNWAHYKKFNETAYGHKALRNRSVNALTQRARTERQGKRLVHCHSHNDSFLCEHTADLSERFVNVEHASLYMSLTIAPILGLDSLSNDPVYQFVTFIKKITSYTDNQPRSTPAIESEAQEEIEQNILKNESIKTKILELNHAKYNNGDSIFQRALKVILSNIEQRYLQNNLSDADITKVIDGFLLLCSPESTLDDDARAAMTDSLKKFDNEETSADRINWQLFIDDLKSDLQQTLKKTLVAKLELFEHDLQQLIRDYDEFTKQPTDTLRSNLKSKVEYISAQFNDFLNRKTKLIDRIASLNSSEILSQDAELYADFQERFTKLEELISTAIVEQAHPSTEQAEKNKTCVIVSSLSQTPSSQASEPITATETMTTGSNINSYDFTDSSENDSLIVSPISKTPSLQDSEQISTAIMDDERKTNVKKESSDDLTDSPEIEEAIPKKTVKPTHHSAEPTEKNETIACARLLRDEVISKFKLFSKREDVHRESLLQPKGPSIQNILRSPTSPLTKNPPMPIEIRKTLNTLCKNYMNYALKKLNLEFTTGVYPGDLASNRARVHIPTLQEKYNFTKTLYDLTQNQNATINEFNEKLNNAKNKKLLATHRDNLFTRFLASIWGALTIIPRALLYSTPSGRISHPCFWLSKGENLTLSCEKTLKPSI